MSLFKYPENKKKKKALMKAAEEGDIASLKSLLKNGINIQLKYNKGNTALHIASKSGHQDFVSTLLAKGADVNAKL